MLQERYKVDVVRCLQCGKKTPANMVSNKGFCATCIGMALITGGKLGGVRRAKNAKQPIRTDITDIEAHL